MLDAVLRDGHIYVSGQLIRGGIGIQDGKIVDIWAGSGTHASAAQEFPCEGKVVLPGLIDTHVHCRDLEHSYKEDFATATRAAAMGGVTTVCDMPNSVPPTTTGERYREKVTAAARQAYVDFAIWGSGVNLEELEHIAATGAIGYKIYLHTSTMKGTPHHRGVFVEDDGQLVDIFERVRDIGLPLMIHLDNQAISDRIRQRLIAEGRNAPLDYLIPWKSVAMEAAALKVLLFSERIRTRIHIAHAPNPSIIDQVSDAKNRNVPVTVEVIIPHLFISYEDLVQLGPYALPSTRPQEQIDAYWDRINRRMVDTIGTDHAPHTRAEKEIGYRNIWRTAPGVPSIEACLGLLLNEVNRGRIGISDVTRLTAENPAALLNFPNKGRIAPGCDADLVVVDMSRQWTISDEGLETKPGWSPYRGRQIQGKAVMTMVRGRVVMRDCKIVGRAGWGRHQRPHA